MLRSTLWRVQSGFWKNWRTCSSRYGTLNRDQTYTYVVVGVYLTWRTKTYFMEKLSGAFLCWQRGTFILCRRWFHQCKNCNTNREECERIVITSCHLSNQGEIIICCILWQSIEQGWLIIIQKNVIIIGKKYALCFFFDSI